MFRILFTCILLIAINCKANETINQRDIRAALIYNFAQYTAWSEQNEQFFNICIFEHDEENINVNILNTKKIKNKPIRVEIITSYNALDSCKVLYIENTSLLKENNQEEIIRKHNVLTIAEIKPSSLSNQGIIQIWLEKKRYQFSINNEAAKQLGLTISSKLLRLANKVQ